MNKTNFIEKYRDAFEKAFSSCLNLQRTPSYVITSDYVNATTEYAWVAFMKGCTFAYMELQ